MRRRLRWPHSDPLSLRLAAIVTLICLWVVPLQPAGAAPAEIEARLRSAVPADVPVPVGIAGPAAPLMRLLGLAGEPVGRRLRVHEGAAEVPAQWEVREGQAACSWIAPKAPTASGERVFRLSVEPAGEGGQGSGAVSATETADAVTVDTGAIRVVHPRKANGGLPSPITFLPDGGTFDRFALNDRLHDKASGRGYFLRYDKQPEVGVESAGPVRVVVRVRARYLDPSGAGPESRPAATYRFIYYAGLPIFRVEAEVSQEKAFAWSEAHFLEWNFHHDFFTHFAVAPGPDATPTVTPFAESKKAQPGAGWAALLNGRVALAMAAGQQTVYDDKAGYGRYLHGPWFAWDGQPRSVAATVYAGPAELAPEKLAASVGSYLRAGSGSSVTVRVPALETRLAKASARVGQGDVVGRWMLRQAANAARSLATLSEASSWVARVEARKPLKAAGAGVAIEELPDVKVATDGVIALGFRKAGEGWSLCSLYHCPTGHEFLESAVKPPVLWQARVHLPDGKTSDALAGGPAALTVDRSKMPARIVLRLSWPGELKIAATIILNAGTGLSLWRVSAAAPEAGRSLWEMDFPVLTGLGSREHPERDTVAVPQSWGKAYPNPTATLSRYGADYPSGSWSMQYALLYHEGAGLYLGVHDPRASSKRFSMATDRDASGAAVAFTATHYPPDMGEPGRGWAAPYDAVVGVYVGDWYEGSRIYRRWVETAPWLSKGPLAKRKDVGTAMRPLALWMLGGGSPAEFVPQVKRFQEFFGVPMGVHWYNWHQIPFDNDYPHYFPTKPGFREGVAELTARGVAVMPYINGRLWDTDTDDWAAAKPAAAMRADGENYVEEYGSKQKLAPMCPTTPLWQAKMKETVLRLVREEGVTGVYLDQITAARPALCFNREHGHPLGGGDHWWTGYRRLLGDIRVELGRTHPAAFLTSENNSEPWIDFLEGHLTWVPAIGGLVPLYGAVYGGYTYPFSRQTMRAALDNRHAAAIEFATQFLWGGQLGWLGTDILDDKYRPEAEYLRLLAQTRAKCIPYLAEGEMLKPPALLTPVPTITGKTGTYGNRTLEDTVPAVQTAAWRAADGTVAFLVTNLSTEPQRFAWEIDFAGHRLGKAAILAPLGQPGASRIVGPRLRREETIPARGLTVLIARPAK